ncbi:DUF1707 domain-containing protein [Dactylosporangium roseum]|uniref:DUF1707 domain-containing protein n=1 Tax=Dactylosporangium roseum TaxID=47989 RepID=A0ABY5Z1W5_9ACTN|nr:DUF1707 domain-containing protein [Dactylosporangium roseum]
MSGFVRHHNCKINAGGAYAEAVRASDEDRERVIAALHRHTEAGRLTLDEFAERVGTVYAAKTIDDLRAATVDLPVLAPVAAPSGAATSNERQLLLTFLLAVVAVVLVGTAYALFN